MPTSIEIQLFLNRYRLLQCYEVNGRLYKHIENAEAANVNRQEIIIHTATAGVKHKAK